MADIRHWLAHLLGRNRRVHIAGVRYVRAVDGVMLEKNETLTPSKDGWGEVGEWRCAGCAERVLRRAHG
jgi:hypothetical protein